MKKVKITYIPSQYQQGGKTITNSQMLTGNYQENSNNPNVNVEGGEYTKNSETGQVKEVAGKKHIQGGENINLPNQSKVLSDYTKVGATHAKTLSEMFDIKLKAADTFATVLDKYNSKIGVKKLEEEEKELLEKFEKNSKSSIDQTTKQINEDFLAQEIGDINKKKEALNKLKSEAFEAIFKVQETVPKKGNGQEILDKNGKPISEKQTGGVVDERIQALAAQYGMQPEEILQILEQGGNKYQEGGEAQQGGQDQVQQIIVAYAQATGVSPDEVVQQLQQMQPEQQQAALQQMVQALQGGQEQEESEMQQGGQLPIAQEAILPPNLRDPYYTFPTQVTPLVANYTNVPILDQPTLAGVEYMQPYVQGKGYGAKMADVEKTINTHDWYFNTDAKKKAFREAVKKEGAQSEVGAFQKAYNDELAKRAREAGYGVEDVSNLINSVGFSGKGVQQLDEKFGAFTSTRPLLKFAKKSDTTNAEGVVPTPAGVVPTEGQQKQPVKGSGVKNVLYDKGMPYIIPPSAPIAPYLQQTQLSRLEGQKGSVENTLAANENARQAMYDSLSGLPPAQRAALLASSLASSGQSDVQGIAAQEMQDLQNKTRIEGYNASVADKEALLNESLKKQYERESFGTLNVNEQSWRNYYQSQEANRKAISDEIDRRNILNTQLDNYQLTGNGIEFVNKTPFIGQDPQAAAYMNWFNTLTPEQKIAERKKQYDLMSKKA